MNEYFLVSKLNLLLENDSFLKVTSGEHFDLSWTVERDYSFLHIYFSLSRCSFQHLLGRDDEWPMHNMSNHLDVPKMAGNIIVCCIFSLGTGFVSRFGL